MSDLESIKQAILRTLSHIAIQPYEPSVERTLKLLMEEIDKEILAKALQEEKK